VADSVMRFEVLTVVTVSYSLMGCDTMKSGRRLTNISQEPEQPMNIYHVTW